MWDVELRRSRLEDWPARGRAVLRLVLELVLVAAQDLLQADRRRAGDDGAEHQLAQLVALALRLAGQALRRQAQLGRGPHDLVGDVLVRRRLAGAVGLNLAVDRLGRVERRPRVRAKLVVLGDAADDRRDLLGNLVSANLRRHAAPPYGGLRPHYHDGF